MENTFTFIQINTEKSSKYNINVSGIEYFWLISGYTDINTRFCIYQSIETGLLIYKKQKGPRYCIGSKLKKSTYKYFNLSDKKYNKILSELKDNYNNHLEKISKETNKTNILI